MEIEKPVLTEASFYIDQVAILLKADRSSLRISDDGIDEETGLRKLNISFLYDENKIIVDGKPKTKSAFDNFIETLKNFKRKFHKDFIISWDEVLKHSRLYGDFDSID